MSGVPWKTKRQTGHRFTRGLKHQGTLIQFYTFCKFAFVHLLPM